MIQRLLVAATLTITGCGYRAFQVSEVSANSHSLQCAISTAGALGYSPIGGGLTNGFVQLERRAGSGAKVRDEVLMRGLTAGLFGANSVTADLLTVQSAAGEMRITAASVYEDGRAGRTSKASQDNARSILGACAAP